MWPNHNKTELSKNEEEKCHFFARLNFVCFFAVEGRYEHIHFPCRHEIHVLLLESEMLLAMFKCDVFGNSFGKVALVFHWNWVENWTALSPVVSHFSVQTGIHIFVWLYVLYYILSASCVFPSLSYNWVRILVGHLFYIML